MEIVLQEPFKSTWRKGYLRVAKDGRKRVDLINNKHNRTTISYARYLVSVDRGELVDSGVEVDHIDNDRTNDSLDNLQELEVHLHRAKTASEVSGRSFTILICPNCNKEFQKETRNMKPFTTPKCSRKCNGEYSRKIQLNRPL